MERIIPIMTCFNNNYVPTAGVCFYSLLENANPNFTYKIYILHSDITDENQKLLKGTISKFKNAELVFKNMQNKFEDIFEKIKAKAFYSKEMFYKFIAPSLFPEYKKIIITDVDVCFLGDISQEYSEINLNNFYIGAYKAPVLKGGLVYNFFKSYEENFSKEELKAIQYSGGYYIYNLEKMREDNLEARFIDFIEQNSQRVFQPEQDAINITCYPKIKDLKSNAIVCTYFYDTYKTEADFNNDLNYTAQELKFALENPIQLHYATHIKPWNIPNSIKAEFWYKYLKDTPFYFDVIKRLELRKKEGFKSVLSFKFKKKRYKLIVEEKG